MSTTADALGDEFLTGLALTATVEFQSVIGPNNLTINGSTGTKASGTTWANPSDARIKQDVMPYGSGLAEVLKLEPVSFKYRPQTNYPQELLDKRQVGFIAQAVEKVMTDMVTSAPGEIGDIKLEDMRTLDTNNLIFALVNAVKELKAEIDALKKRGK